MIRPKKDGAAHAREDAFLGDLVPQVTEQLAERRSGDFDAVAGQARFETWLAAHTKESAVPAPRVRVPARRPSHPPAMSATRQGRVPWRSVGVGVVALATPVGIGVLHPLLAEAFTIIELVVLLTIIGTALFGSPIPSERAFRLLRWIGNRSESPRPTPVTSKADGDDSDGDDANRGQGGAKGKPARVMLDTLTDPEAPWRGEEID